MEDGNPASVFGQPQRTHHPRPFFYVQPPSQPYYMYQPWQLNPSYAPYSMPGAYSYGRPCLPSYPYLQYQGMVLPPPPLLDYRRMFEPRFPCPPWHDAPRPPHPAQGPRGADPGDPVAPSDALAKLIACLSRIRAGDLGGELDSGVASQGSGEGGGGQGEEPTEAPAPGGQSMEPCWPGGLEEDLPLDSSSAHEHCHDDQQLAPEEPIAVPPAPPGCARGGTQPPGCAGGDTQPPGCARGGTQPPGCAGGGGTQPPGCAGGGGTQPPGCAGGGGTQPPGCAGGGDTQPPGCSDTEAVSCLADPLAELVLQLPLGGAVRPLLSLPASPYAALLPPGGGGGRVSVLSPSLDELSSRDELFSTDLEDLELLPRRPYTGGAWEGRAPRYTCACCGSSLGLAPARPLHEEDSDEEQLPPRVLGRRPRSSLALRHGRSQRAGSVHDRETGEEGGGRRTARGRLLKDRQEDLSPPDPERWPGADLKPRRKHLVLHRQDVAAGRKRFSRPACPRSRDERKDEEEGEPHRHCDRDSTNDHTEVF